MNNPSDFADLGVCESQVRDSGRRRFIEALSAGFSLAAFGCGGGEAAGASDDLSAAGVATSPPQPSSSATAPAPDPVPAPAPAPPAPGTALTATRITAATTGTVPYSFGQVFVQGHVPADAGLQGLQFDVVSNWPDGSARFGIVSGVLSVNSGVAQDVVLGVGSPTSGQALAIADLKAQLVQPVRIGAGAFGAASWSGSDWDAPFRVWAAGPMMSSWVYRKPIGNDPHLVGWLEVRLWKTGAVEVLPWIENGYLRVPGPTNKSATYIFTLGGSERFSALIDLPHHCRTPLLSGTSLSHWLGADPGVLVTHDADYLMQSEMVPTYFARVSSSAEVVTSQPPTFTPLQAGNFPSGGFGHAGYDPSIGLLPEGDVLYLTCRASSVWSAVQRQGYTAGRYGIHYRDENTNLPARVLDHPNLTLYGTDAITDVGTSTTGSYPPRPSGTRPPTFAVSHHPSLGYMAALLTGRLYHIETTQFVCTSLMLKSSDSPSARNYKDGLIRTERGEFGTRGSAWALRSLAQSVAISPPGTIKTELQRVLNNNVEYHHARYVLGPSCPFGFTASYSDFTVLGEGLSTGAASTSTLVVFESGHNIYKNSAGYDGRYNGYKLSIGGETRIVTSYDAMSATATVSVPFTVRTASVPFEIGDQLWLNSPWLLDFYSAAWGYMKALRLLDASRSAKLDAFYGWNAQSVVGRFGTDAADEYLYRDAVPYTMSLSPSDHTDWQGGTGPWYSNWGQIWADTQAHSPSIPNNVKTLGDGSLRVSVESGDNPANPTGYWGNVQPALAYAVRHNIPGASAAYGRMTGAPNWPRLRDNFDLQPVWAVRPAI